MRRQATFADLFEESTRGIDFESEARDARKYSQVDPARGNEVVPSRWQTTPIDETNGQGDLEMPWQAMPISAVGGPGAATEPMWMPSAPPTVERVLAWHPQPIPVLPLIILILLLLYGSCVIVLHRRGIRWPISRSIFWLAGVASVLMVTATAVNGYGMELFSVHMIQHMVLNMLSPVFLAIGAPVTLLLYVLPVGSGRQGRIRRGLLRLLRTRGMAILMHPAVTFVLFIMSLYGLYYTPAFDYLMGTWWGHNLMLLLFLLIGFIYFWGVLGVDPSPRTYRRGHHTLSGSVMSVLELAATAPFHAFFGVVVMMSTTLLVRFYSMPMPGWQVSPLADQATGGGIAWSFMELPTLLVLIALVMKWQKSDERRTRAAERRQVRGGDTGLAAYNAYLQTLNSADMAQH
jgi:putative membrane protein